MSQPSPQTCSIAHHPEFDSAPPTVARCCRDVVEVIIVIIFTLEFVARLASCPTLKLFVAGPEPRAHRCLESTTAAPSPSPPPASFAPVGPFFCASASSASSAWSEP